MMLATGAPHAEGACAFLDVDGGCRIYADRPYVCRTQGLPLRWLEDQEEHAVELRDICPLNEVGEPIERLPAQDCWTLGLFEERLARLELASRASAAPSGRASEPIPAGAQRTALRALFVTK